MSTLLVAYFWNVYLIGALGDFYCVAMFFGFLLYVIKTGKEKKFRYVALSGLLFGMMTNWRVAYWHECLLMIAMYGVIHLYERRRKQKEKASVWLIAYSKTLVNRTKKYVFHLLIAVMCFFIIAIPQGITNFKSGHMGFPPYDSPQAYGGHLVTWSAWNTFLSYGMVLWPKFVGDDQLMTMKSQLYADRWQILYPQQAMDVYANSPIEFASCMIKKFLQDWILRLIEAEQEEWAYCGYEGIPYVTRKRYAESALTVDFREIPSIRVRFPVVVSLEDYTKRMMWYVEHIVNHIPMYIDNLKEKHAYISAEDLGTFLDRLSDSTEKTLQYFEKRRAINAAGEGIISQVEIC